MPRGGWLASTEQPLFRANAGQGLKTFFTIRLRARYASAMLMLAAAAAIAVSSPDAGPSAPVKATVRATASVRIVSGTTISWGTASNDLPRMRLTRVRDAAGTTQPIRLIEFE